MTVDSETSEVSDFRSAIDWRELRPAVEQATGEFRPLAEITARAIDSWIMAWSIAPLCESPIEIDLGAQLCKIIRTVERLSLQPQFPIDRYRYDFAILDEPSGEPLALIECDGREFHETAEQRGNDKAKDELATKKGILLFRFSGSEIYRDAPGCVSMIFRKLQASGLLSRQEWSAIVSILPTPRPRYDFSVLDA